MNTIYKALQAGLMTACNTSKFGVTIYSTRKPNGVYYSWEKFYKDILPALSSKLKQLEETEANTLEPQA